MNNRNLDSKDLRTYPVQPKPCKTCPFEGEEPVELTPRRYEYFINNLCGKGQHLCHSANNKAICRGGRNIQLRWLCAIGAIPEPTDEAFNAAINEVMSKVNLVNPEKE
ncbi:hypothetical protein [Microseira sp. BLCC-F43]|jgi:hypothetical protein|uniref:hypothetical protein n=1 Tax=Microseira sp. BLCC-F43 TaxID=3153602 RepID=UPI0035B738AA